MVKESVERNIPIQKVFKTFKKKWMTQEVLNVVKEKHKAYNKYRRLRTNMKVRMTTTEEADGNKCHQESKDRI